MASETLQQRRAILLGVAGAVVAVSCMLAVGFFLTRSAETPADYLPSDRVDALFLDYDNHTRKTFERAYPELRALESVTAPAHVAILTGPPGVRDWILFEEDETDVSTRVGRFTVRASSQSALQAIVREGTLGGDGEYLALTRGLAPTGRSAFLRLERAAGSGAVRVPLFWESDGSGATLSVRGAPPLSTRALSTAVVPLDPKPSMMVAFYAAPSLWDWMTGILPSPQRLGTQALLEQWTASWLGSDASVTYDLFPLLDEPTRLATRSAGSGTSVFLEGSSTHALEMRAAIDRLHESTKRTLSTIVKRTRTFDDRFTSVTMEEDPEALREEKTRRGGWDIRTTTNASGRGLLSAVRDNDYLLSTDAAWFAQALDVYEGKQSRTPMTELSSPGLLATGQASRAAFLTAGAAEWTALLPTLRDISWIPEGAVLDWAALRRGDVLLFTLRARP